MRNQINKVTERILLSNLAANRSVGNWVRRVGLVAVRVDIVTRDYYNLQI